ncbi:MAG: carbohydrate ABC transporter permease [Saccharofermentanales bacterium]|jgi:putative aldouronate transport system permease protein|nr:carbohydrate ABC transporter permease [Clostridiaceae bacterium]
MAEVRLKRFSFGQLFLCMILMLFSLAAILPFLLLVISSVTSEEVLLVNGYSYFPTKLSFYSYEYLFTVNLSSIGRAYGITVFITVVGTTLSLMIAPMMAYVLSRRDYNKRKVMTFVVFFTMLFNGGLVPQYLMWTQLFGIKNTIFALLFPNLLFNGFFVLIMKSYFTLNIHPALIEAAKIDGASEFYIYRKIVMPLSLPILATIGLMVGINYWNDWMNGLYYITKNHLFSLQNLLNRILVTIRFLNEFANEMRLDKELPSISIRMAMAVIGTIPIMALYPFFQKYFVKGISLGGVKG